MWSWLYKIVTVADCTCGHSWQSTCTQQWYWFDSQDPESGVRGDSVCLHCVIVLNDQLIIMKKEVVRSCWISICIFSETSDCDFPVQPHTSCWSARTFAPPSGGTREASTAYNANFPTCISWYKAPTPFKLSPLPGETNLSAGMAINVAYTSGTTDNLSRFQLWHNYLSICHHCE